MLSSTPAAKYDQRQNREGVVCTLNDNVLPRSWSGSGAKVTIAHYDPETALKSPYQYMFQKVSEKALSESISFPAGKLDPPYSTHVRQGSLLDPLFAPNMK